MSDERTEWTRLLPDPAGHELTRDRHQMLREQFMQHIDQSLQSDGIPQAPGASLAPQAPRAPGASQAPGAAPKRRRRPWVVASVATASLMAIVLVLGAISAVNFGVGKFWAGRTPAGGLLERIALVAANSTDIPPADQVRDDQFEYIETYGGFGVRRFVTDKAGNHVVESTPLDMHDRQIWKSVNGASPGLLRDPNVSDSDINLGTINGAYLNYPTFRYLTTLPTNPDILLAKIYVETWGAGPSRQQEAFVTIGDLMRESIVPPRLAKALYQAAARIPGIVIIDDAVDALGRHGVAIARTDAGMRIEWIFDRSSLQFLGERTVTTQSTDFGPAGTVTGSTAIVTRAIVDRAGEVPG